MTRRRSSWPSAHGRLSNGSGLPAVDLHAPIAGVIVAVHATVGEHVQTETPVFTLLNTETVLIEAQLPEADLARLGSSYGATYETSAAPGTFVPLLGPEGTGRLVVLGTTVDAKTRTVPLVYEVPNPDGRLRIGMALNVYVETATVAEALVVPVSALVEEDGRTVAFVQVSGETFDKRDLTLGMRDGAFVQVLAGLAAGERVVTKGAYAIRSGVRLDHHSRAWPCPLRGASHDRSGDSLVPPQPGGGHRRGARAHRSLASIPRREMPVDVFPDLTAPTVTVITEAHGMAPTEVESQVTFPIEAALNGASGVRRVRSSTAVGISVVWVEFDWGMDIYAARQIVSEKVALIAGELPPEVSASDACAHLVDHGRDSLSGADLAQHSPIELRTTADTVLRRRLLSVPGVSQVTPIGGGEKQYQVLLSPAKLQTYGVSLKQVTRALAASNENVSAGFLVVSGAEYLVTGRGRMRTLEDIGDTVVAAENGVPIRVCRPG